MKRLLVVVDYQNDLVSGPLGFPQAKKIDKKIADKIMQYHTNHDVVGFALNYHTRKYLGTQEGQYLPILHCIEGTEGAELYGETGKVRKEQDRQFESSTFGAASFFRHLDNAQRSAAHANVKAFRSIELVGIVTNTSLLADAILAKTACPEVPIYVDASCVASPSRKANEEALDIMESMQIIVTNRRQKASAIGPWALDATNAQKPLKKASSDASPSHSASVFLDDTDIENLKNSGSDASIKHSATKRNPAYTGTADITVPDGVSASEDSTAPMKPISNDDE